MIVTIGGFRLMLVQICWLSTTAQLVPGTLLLEVNVEFARSLTIVPDVGAIVPWVALHVTGICGKSPKEVVSAAFELSVMSAVTVEFPSGAIGLGEALTPRTIHGLKSTPAPVTTPQPAVFGPVLQPHQLFSITPFNVPV